MCLERRATPHRFRRRLRQSAWSAKLFCPNSGFSLLPCGSSARINSNQPSHVKNKPETDRIRPKMKSIIDLGCGGTRSCICRTAKPAICFAMIKGAWCLPVILLLPASPLYAQIISVPDNFARLVAQEDTDGDKKITVHDHLTPFEIYGTNNAIIETVNGAYPLSVLLQSLKRAEDENCFEISLAEINLDEPAATRTHRLIKQYYWDALTRQIDATHLSRVVSDSKSDSADDYLYVPAADTNAVRYFESLSNVDTPNPLKIVLLPSPDKFTGRFVRSLDGAHGLLSLALMTNADGTISGEPYVVPGGRFNELYCWDSYFITLGLLQDGTHGFGARHGEQSPLRSGILWKNSERQPHVLSHALTAAIPHLHHPCRL
jgi:hypothetical protein